MATTTQIPPSPAIEFTFDVATHCYRNKANKRPVLSVTQVLDSVGIVDYANAPAEALQRKSELGTYVHSAVHALLTPDEGELDWDTVPEAATPYILAAEKFVEETQFKPELVEYQNCVTLPQGPVGFRIDAKGKIGGYPVILEVKCALKEEKSWAVQLAGYEECILALGMKPEGAPVYKRIACQLRPDGRYKLWLYEDRRDKIVWQQALFLATWKMNNGYALEKR